MIAGVEPPRCWTRISLVLELTIAVTAAAAGVLTAGTLIRAEADVAPLGVRQCATRIRTDSLFTGVLLLSVAPTLMWTVCKIAWGLDNDLAGGPSAGWVRLADRLFDGFSPQYLFNFLTVRATAIWPMIAALTAIAMFSVHQRLTLHRGAIVAATTSALYFCGLYVMYLSKPLGLNSHLTTSATRTMATASMALLVSMCFLLSDLEVSERHGRHGSL